MKTNFKGRLRNTTLSPSRALMPIFEAVVNSIHAINDVNLSDEKGEIRVEIIRQDHRQLCFSSKSQSSQNFPIAFRIVDNGIGFTEENMDSFNELDSGHKQERGGRGVGRLLWLKEFQTVTIESCFEEHGKLCKRTFCFDENNEVSQHILSDIPPNEYVRKTTVTLEGIYEKFQRTVNKRSDTVAREIFEHCLGYYLSGNVPNIFVCDKSNDEIISLNDIYVENLSQSIMSEELNLDNQSFKLVHVRLRKVNIDPKIYYCVNQRSVRSLNLSGKIPGLFKSLKDEFGVFYYACYVTSSFLDERLYPDRTGFDIRKEEFDNDTIFQDQIVDISLGDIDAKILQKIEIYLAPYLEESRQKSYNRIVDFIETKAPHYRPLLNRMSKERLYLSTNAVIPLALAMGI